MQALIWVGAVLAVLGLGGLAWCIREGLRLRREAARTAPADLVWTGAAPAPAGQRSLNLFEETPATSQAAE